MGDGWKRAVAAAKATRGHKYGAKPTVVDGIRFASKAEARRYSELKLLAKAGKIECLELQPVYVLYAPLTTGTVRGALRAHAGQLPKVGKYVADFRYYDMETGALVVEDVKGYDLPLAKWKRKHTEAQYGITVTLVTR